MSCCHACDIDVTCCCHVSDIDVTCCCHASVCVQITNTDINILFYSLLLRSCAQERESTCTASFYHSPYPIQYRLGILYILTGGDVIETSCIWNIINVLCLDTSEIFCFGKDFFLFSPSFLSFTYPHNGIE